MHSSLLLIDFQNDFIEPKPDASYWPTLPVPGSLGDVERITRFIEQTMPNLQAITVTLDTHPAYGIERPGFWRYADGTPVENYALVTPADIDSGRIVLVNPEHSVALETVRKMAASGNHQLRVWPRHCVEGSHGAAMPNSLMDALNAWEVAHQHNVIKVQKGRNPFTEHFGAMRAAVVLDDHTGTNRDLLRWLTSVLKGGKLFVAGEAGSHCVAETMYDAMRELSPNLLANIVLLTDGMSAVSGYEELQTNFTTWAANQGAQLMTVAQATALVLGA